MLLILAMSPLALYCSDGTVSIMDQAKSSPEIRRQLIAEFEVRPTAFFDDRLLAVGISYVLEGKLDRATLVYDRFLKDQPDNVRALRGRGAIYVLQEHMSEAIPFYKKAWSLGDVDSLQPLASCYINVQQYGHAEELLPVLRAHIQDPKIDDCLIALAVSKDPPNEPLLIEALSALPDKTFVLNQETAQLVEKAANRLRAIDENNKTLQAICQKVIRGFLADPVKWPKSSLSGVGDAYFVLRDYSSADDIYRRVLSDQPTNSAALAGIGALCVMKKDVAGAIGNLRKAWDLGDKKVLGSLSASYLAAGEFAKIEELLPSLLELKTENLENLNSVVAYSLVRKPMDRALFYKVLEGVSDDQILRRRDTTDAVLKGLNAFGDKERFQTLLKKKAEHDKGLRG